MAKRFLFNTGSVLMAKAGPRCELGAQRGSAKHHGPGYLCTREEARGAKQQCTYAVAQESLKSMMFVDIQGISRNRGFPKRPCIISIVIV